MHMCAQNQKHTAHKGNALGFLLTVSGSYRAPEPGKWLHNEQRR